jgi:transposase
MMVCCEAMRQQHRLTAPVEEWRRRRAVELHQAGWTGRAIAAALGVVPSAVSTWLRQVREGGLEALRARRHQTGKRPKLTPEQQQRLLALLQEGAGTQGEVGERWTGKRVAALIKGEFGVVYHPEYIPRLLRGLGWTPQQPMQQATQRDEAKIAAFKAEWAAIKKGRNRRAGRSSG